MLFHQFHNQILQRSLKTFRVNEPRRVNQKVHMANLFHGLRKRSVVSDTHRYSTVTRDNREVGGTQTRRSHDISRRHDIEMTCAEFVVRHEFRPNAGGDSDVEKEGGSIAPPGLSFLSISAERDCNRPHEGVSHILVCVSTKSVRHASLHFDSPSRFYNLAPKFRMIGDFGDFAANRCCTRHGRSRRVANELRNRRRSAN